MTQLRKDYAGDPAKAKSRGLLKSMIERTLLNFRKPSQIEVLCFPGVDAAEIHEVYDPLGIPRANITGLERDPIVLNELERKKLGINLIPNSIEDYAKTEETFPFDVVSLDYTGPISNRNIETLAKISSSQSRNHFVLHQANLAKRDHLAEDLYITGLGYDSGEWGDKINGLEDSRKVYQRVKGLRKKFDSGDEVKEDKSRAYTQILRAAFQGTDLKTLERTYRFSCGRDYDACLDIIEQNFRSLLGSDFKLCRDKPITHVGSIQGNFPGAVRFFENHALENLKTDLHDHGLVNNGLPLVLLSAIVDRAKEKKFFRIKDASPYSYVSESGAPMLGDIFFLSHPERVYRAARSLADSCGFPREFSPDSHFLNRLVEFQKENSRFASGSDLKALSERVKNRVFLGSSAKPVLTKAKALELMRQGVSLEEIRKTHRGWTNKPLSQWKAHLTMGTYDAAPQEIRETVREDPEDGDLEKITKEEAIGLLASGIPPKEINEAYPTSFTLGQLAAYKAHLTMGTYETKNSQLMGK